MSNFQPIVSVICPTTHDRAEFNERIKSIYFGQDYPNKQLLFDYEEGVVGEKRNRLCDVAIGDVILCMDSDDAYASDWITKSVEALIRSEADVVGLSQLLFYNTKDGAWYIYSYPSTMNNWVAGATMCFWKNYWRANPFPYKNLGEDSRFLMGVTKTPKIFPHEYGNGFIAIIHNSNTSTKTLVNQVYRRCTVEEEIVLFDRWKDFIVPPANTI